MEHAGFFLLENGLKEAACPLNFFKFQIWSQALVVPYARQFRREESPGPQAKIGPPFPNVALFSDLNIFFSLAGLVCACRYRGYHGGYFPLHLPT